MGMYTHELHPALTHAPLTLLPMAAGYDVAAVITGSVRLAAAGRRLWAAGVVSALVVGLTGMAASQEIAVDGKASRDMMALHGLGNLAIVVAGAGMAIWRWRHRPGTISAITGVAACGAAAYTAYLGGEMVYARGLGVKRVPEAAEGGVSPNPPLFTLRAAGRLAVDSVKGALWLFKMAGRIAREGLHKESIGIGPEEPADRPPVYFH